MPGPLYNELVSSGYPDIADRLSRQLDPRANPSREDVRYLVQRWDREADGPQTGYDWLAVARLWLKADDAVDARAALDRAQGEIPPALYELESARIGWLEATDARVVGADSAADRASQLASASYWRGCETAGEAASVEYWLDVEILAVQDELEDWDRFRTLPTNMRDLCGWLREFWNRRAIASAMDLEQRIGLHYDRMRYALNEYRRRGKEGPFFSKHFGRPSNAMFDDRGLLYVRMGAPSETAAFGGGTCYEPNVTWSYEYPEGRRLYHLSSLGSADNWWLLRNLGIVFRCGPWDRDPFMAQSLPLGTLPPGALRELYQSRGGLDPAYDRIAYRLGGTQGLQDLHSEYQWTYADAEFAVAGVPERPAVDMGLEFLYETLQFRGARRNQLWLNAAVRAEHLQRLRRDDGRLAYRVDVTLVALGADDSLYRFSRTLDVLPDRPPGVDDALAVRLQAELPAGEYDVTLVVRDARSGGSGNFSRETLLVRELGGTLPILSDIVIAADSGGTWTPGGDVYLRAHPTHETGPDGIAYAYYEAYNLTAGGQYETRVHMEPIDAAGPEFELFYPGETTIGASVSTRRILRLDFTDTEPGEYRMSVTAVDVSSGRATLPSVTTIRVDRVGER